MQRTGRIVIGVAVSVACLWLAFRGVAVADVYAVMRQARPGWLVAVAVAAVVGPLARAQRWAYLFAHLERVPLSSLFASQLIGLAVNAVAPLRAGEAAKALSISRKRRLPFTTAFATVVLERIFDMIAVGTLLVLALLLVPIPDSAGPTVTAAVRLLAGVATAATVAIVALISLRERMLAWLELLLTRLPERLAGPVRRTVHSFVSGLHALTDARQLLAVLAHSAWVWVVLAAPYAFVAVALGLDVAYDLALVPFAIVTTALVAIFVMVPAAPGFVGTYQAGCVVALGIFGIPREEALGYSILVHAVSFAPPTVLGLIALASEGLRLRDAADVV